MTPFMVFRRWLREGPAAERLLAVVSTILAVTLVAWAAAPSGGPSGSAGTALSPEVALAEATTTTVVTPSTAAGAPQSTSTGAAAGSASAMPGPAAATPAAGATAGPAAAQGASTAAPGAGSRCDARATEIGVSAREVKVGYIAYSLGDAGPLIGLPTPEQSFKQFRALVDFYNQNGGIQCRKIVPVFYSDPLTSAAEHDICLRAQSDRIFAMVADLFTPQERNCIAQQKISNVMLSPPPTPIVRQFFPYIISFRADTHRIVRDYILGAEQVGFFGGMAKLGMLDQTCYPDLRDKMYEALAEAGIGRDRISSYSYGCPSTANTPDQDVAAALQFKRDGVTHVVGNAYGWPGGFARAANQQGYRPKYALMDDNSVALVDNANPPVDASFDGAITIEKLREGDENVPGMRWDAATQECIRITTAAGLESPVTPDRTAIYGGACAMLKVLVKAAEATVPLTRVGLAKGVAALGGIELSWPAGKMNFHDPGNPTGSQFWRVATYHAACNCFRPNGNGAWFPEFS